MERTDPEGTLLKNYAIVCKHLYKNIMMSQIKIKYKW